ncbi:hypothetical protein EI94DRAFT_1708291 [Lactarius quietus]|nr:hypothetical protein EI94DRAFT_1708291 [Lactarius quietus]
MVPLSVICLCRLTGLTSLTLIPTTSYPALMMKMKTHWQNLHQMIPCSHMLGSTSHSSLKPSNSFPRRIPDVPPRLSLSTIESLTVSELYYNPHYRQLHQEYNHLSRILEAYWDLVHPSSANNSVVPNVYQAITQSSVNSHSSSLGPSDSTSQQTRPTDFELEAAVEKLLELSVLWDYEDCNNAVEGIIITEANKRRPKMNLAIRCGDRTNISNQEYVNIRRAADIICTRLLNQINTDPNSALLLTNKSQTKLTLKKTFGVEYHQAILNLEAEQKILHLCLAHWKADAVIGHALLWRSEVEAKAASNCTAKPSSDVKDSQPSVPFAAFVPQASARNAAKRGFVQSLGPKSPLAALPPQKRSRDVVSGKNTTGHPRHYDPLEKQRPAEPIVPSFLSCTNNLVAEAAPAKPCPVSFEPTASFPPPPLTASNLSNMIYSRKSHRMPSEQVTALLKRVQFADPASPDIDEDNVGQSWGHYQFTAGGISPSSSLTSWEDVGNVATAFKLVAAGLKTCQEADIYLEQILNRLEKCWTDAGGTLSSQCRAVVPTTPTSPTSYCEVAKASVSPWAHLVKLTFKQAEPIPDVLTATQTSNAPTGSDSTIPQQPSSGTESMWEPSAGLDKGGTRTDVLSLKLLQVPELQGIFADMKPGAPKPKRKDVQAEERAPKARHHVEMSMGGGFSFTYIWTLLRTI